MIKSIEPVLAAMATQKPVLSPWGGTLEFAREFEMAMFGESDVEQLAHSEQQYETPEKHRPCEIPRALGVNEPSECPLLCVCIV